MKRFLILALSALMAFVACDEANKDQTPEGGEQSVEGRWNVLRFAEDPDFYGFVLIFKESSLDLYIIPYGHHLQGSYTYSNGVVSYNITAGYQAFTDVTFDGEGNMTSYLWESGNLDQNTLTLAEGFDWYPMSEETLEMYKEECASISFSFNAAGGVTLSGVLGLEDLTAFRQK